MSVQAADHVHASTARCDPCVSRREGICAVLPVEQLETLSSTAERHTVPAGQHVFRDGEEVTTFASILSGAVKLIKAGPGGEQHVIGLMYAPEFLGHSFSGRHRFSAIAATDVELCSFPCAAFGQLLLEYPPLERWLFELTVRELDLYRDWTLMLSRKSSYERVASLLLMIARRSGLTGRSAAFDLPLTRSEFADYLGLTIETVSRKISQLKGDGVIELRGTRAVIVPDIELLTSAADMDGFRDKSAGGLLN